MHINDEIKGSPEGSSDQEFRSSILCDVIENSWWLISRSIENLLKMTSLNFRVDPPVSACLRDWIQKWNGFPSELSLKPPAITIILVPAQGLNLNGMTGTDNE